jgi:ribosome assembly protein YihI (activator of Der GTPase)
MTKERHQSRCLLFTIATLRLMEREKEWNADTLDRIADFALDLGLATADENGNFIVEKVDKE